ncbi:MAG: ribose 5-phosphate isomerase B [Rickettsiales bacterium]|jgi:ribose 5-phosphate isomerase B
MTKNTIAIASDHGGFELKQSLSDYLRKLGAVIIDLGTNSTESVDYPDYGFEMGKWIAENPEGKGILICGSGIGISIAANRNMAVRAAVCHDGLSARLSRNHNDANVLCLGARLIGVETAKDCVNNFINSDFEGGRHASRVEKLSNFVKKE